MKKLIVDENFDGKKLDVFLRSNFDGLTYSSIHKALRKKDISVNGKHINTNTTLHENDELIIYIQDKYLYFDVNKFIIYEDDFIILINKPYELEVTGDNSLTSMLKKLNNSIESCHRIDRNTTGLVLFAKTKESLDILLDAFKNRKIVKNYACLVYGIPNKNNYSVKSYLFKNAKESLVYISDTPKKGYKDIITSYKVIKMNKRKNISLLDVNIQTGRTHQIRAHLAHLGYPIIGDGKYGINDVNRSFKVKSQLLCAYKLSFKLNSNSILNYLNNIVFEIPYIEYFNKYMK